MSIARDDYRGRIVEPIAIIGMGCRFPGGGFTPQSFWDFLRRGGDGITDVPADRWSIPTFYHTQQGKKAKIYTRKGGFLNGIDGFDPTFFGISPREAHHMDPQQRLLLEVAWEAFEDGGMIPEAVAGSSVGVFIGLFMHDYENIQTAATEHDLYDAHSATGFSTTIAANRLSYVFDLKGPSMVVDTACSSSLVAVHLACRSLWEQETSLALAGGVNVLIKPEVFMSLCQASMLSPDGYCKSFDARADGYTRSEGAGMVLLKRLSEAIADEDPIYAIIRGSAVNQDGRTEGITVPNAEAQKAVIRDAFRCAGLAPGDVGYVEAHGTGTAVGDPIEAEALGTVFSAGRPAEERCIVGSVKSNIGHTESAAGIAGLIKAALMLKNRQIPPNLHFETPNPAIPFETLKIRVPTSLEPWDVPDGTMRYAGINSFGFGGTNAHVILQEHVPRDGTDSPHRRVTLELPCIVPLSARSREALNDVASRHLAVCEGDTEPVMTPRDIGVTTALHRGHHPWRMTLAARSLDDYREGLEAFLQGGKHPGVSTGVVRTDVQPTVAFIFSGMGQQWWNMGRQLLEQSPVFRDMIHRCDKLFRRHTQEWSLLDELTAQEEVSRVNETRIAQPCILSLQAAVTELYRSWGIEPDIVVGHSVGEIAAAWASGALTLEEAVTLCYHRSRLQHTLSGHGAMLALGLPEKEIAERFGKLGNEVSIAAINAANSVTLSGDKVKLEAIREALVEENVFARFLKVDVPYHSPSMESILAEFHDSLNDLSPGATSIGLVSTVTGGIIEGELLDGTYWCRNVREPVLFRTAMHELHRRGCNLFVEVGAHPVLGPSIKECCEELESGGEIIAGLRRGCDEPVALAQAAGKLYCHGYPLDWKGIYADGGTLVKLPPYPWQRERYWTESEESRHMRTGEATLSKRMPVGAVLHPLLGGRMTTALPTWNASIDLDDVPYLEDHVVEGAIVFPGAAYVEMALAAARHMNGHGSHGIEDISFTAPLILQRAVPPMTQFVMEDGLAFSIYAQSGSEDTWVRHAHGRLSAGASQDALQGESVDEIRDRCPQEVGGDVLYDRFAKLGLSYGPAFRNVKDIQTGDEEALGLIETDDLRRDGPGPYCIYPACLDASFQLLGALASEGTFLPVGIKRVQWWSSPGQRVWGHVRLVEHTESVITGDVRLIDDEGNLLVEIAGLRCRNVKEPLMESTGGLLYRYEWQPMPRGDEEKVQQDAGFLPGPERIKEEVDPGIPAVMEDCRRKEYYEGIEPALNALTAAYIADGMRQLGFPFTGRSPVTTEEFMAQTGVLEKHKRVTELLLGILEQEGPVRRIDTVWHGTEHPEAPSPRALWNDVLRKHPECLAELTLIDRFGSEIGDLLTGSVDAPGLLFEPGSATAEHFYHHSPSLEIYNRIVRETMASLLDPLPQERTIKILEVGAGTGSTTAAILSLLQGRQVEYVFTDLSKAFTQSARHQFGQYPFIQFRELDIEGDIEEQGFKPHSFDIVVAGNVMHATRDLRDTLGTVQGLLAPRGILMMLELINPSYFFDMIFGMLEGWWLFSDYDLRPDHPTVSREQWDRILRECGFTETAMIADDIDGHEPLEAVILARAPGPSSLQSLPEVDEPEVLSTTGDRPWLILADRSNLVDRLTALLEDRGIDPLVVTGGDSFQRIDPRRISIRPGDADDMARAIESLCPETGAAPVVIDLWDMESTEEMITAETLAQQTGDSCTQAVHLIQSLGKQHWEGHPTVYCVTAGVYPIGDHSAPALVQSPLWGLGRVIMTEHPDMEYRLVDLSPNPAAEELRCLYREVQAGGREDEIALRGNDRYVHRLIRSNAFSDNSSGDRPYRINSGRTKTAGKFEFIEADRGTPGPGEVELQVCAVGINFKDVAKVSGLFSHMENGINTSLGMEASGVILRTGEGVDNLAAGDEVMGLVKNGFANYIVTDAYALVKKPAHLTFEEAAGIPLVFMTACHALHSLAQIKAGERLLVHTGSGGLGLALIQVARAAGAEVFATAGTPGKRAFLCAMGIPYVGDSRTRDFAREIMEITQNEGVDIVINTLSAEAMASNIAVLKPVTGRLVDLTTLHTDTSLAMKGFARGLMMAAFDLEAMKNTSPEYLRSLIGEVVDHFRDGTLHPIPYRVYPVATVSRAFRNMQKGHHMGKQVLSMRGKQVPIIATREHIPLNPDGSYLIIGGLGGFGRAVARWMISCGARHLVLTGRSSPDAPRIRETLETLQQDGIRVRYLQADITDAEQLHAALHDMDRDMPPLRGVIHAAMVLDDGPVIDMTAHRLHTVLDPKIRGAWNLHTLTEKMDLDFFICFSSFASLVGNANQANYAAANAFLDTLAHYRKKKGLPALTISWGPMDEVGYVAEHDDVREILHRQGVTSLKLNKAWPVITQGLTQDLVHVGAMSAHWPTLKRFSPSVANSPRFSELIRGATETTEGFDDRGSAEERRMELPASPEERRMVLEGLLLRIIADVLGLPSSQLDVSRPLSDLGFDSLMVVELSLAIEEALGVSLPKMEYLRPGLTTSALVKVIDQKVPESGVVLSKARPAADRNHIEEKDQALTAALSATPERDDDIAPIPVMSQGTALHRGEDEKDRESGKTGEFIFPPEYLALKKGLEGLGPDGYQSVYFNVADGINNNMTCVDGHHLINFSSYNYLGMSGDPIVMQAAKDAIERYGTSVSASRIASGERPLHRELEREITDLVGTEDSIVFVSGYGTNESVIGHMCSQDDLVIYDSFIHASIQEGAKLSGAKVMPFPHNNPDTLHRLLLEHRNNYRQVLIVIEGVYSMDGDIPDLPRFIEIKKRHSALLMVDEAHSMGVIGRHGKGVGEYHHVNPDDVDLWMGTLSKAFASCGGYIAGREDMIEFLKYTSPGFVYSVGLTPPDTAAALAALRLFREEPHRVERLQENAVRFLSLGRERGFNLGTSGNSAVVPLMIGESLRCIRVFRHLKEQGVFALPIIYPAVPENAARIRFFMSCLHTDEQIDRAIAAISHALSAEQSS